MRTLARRIVIKLASGERITVQALPKNEIKKALLERVLPTQVPDAKLLVVCSRHGTPVRIDEGAIERFGLSLKDHSALPDVVAYSKQNDALFFVEAVHESGLIDRTRLSELRSWSRNVECRIVFVSVFASREAYAARLASTATESHIWFADAPTHSVSTSSTLVEAAIVMERHVVYHAQRRHC